MTATPPTQLRARREAAGLTQVELARAARLAVRTVQLHEAGRVRRPRASTRRLLDAALAGASPETGAVRSYADRVPTDPPRRPAGDQTPSDVPTAALPDRYARPAVRLAAAPTGSANPLFWLEPTTPRVVVTPSGARFEPVVTLYRAVPAHVDSRWCWHATALAHDVFLLDGVELVDALRAFRGWEEEG